MLCGGTSSICYSSLQHCLWSLHMRNILLPGSVPLLYVCLVELLHLPESECWDVAFSEIPDMWVTARVAQNPEKCWTLCLLPTTLLSMQCCSFWHTAGLHNTFFFFFSLKMNYCAYRPVCNCSLIYHWTEHTSHRHWAVRVFGFRQILSMIGGLSSSRHYCSL